MSADILIVGSDSAVNEQLMSVLETVGYEVAVSSDVDEALTSLEPGRTSLVFIDTATVGIELGEDIGRIQNLAPNMEFILIAEFQDPLVEQDALQHGVNNWLYRPFTAPEIILKVAEQTCLLWENDIGSYTSHKQPVKQRMSTRKSIIYRSRSSIALISLTMQARLTSA